MLAWGHEQGEGPPARKAVEDGPKGKNFTEKSLWGFRKSWKVKTAPSELFCPGCQEGGR